MISSHPLPRTSVACAPGRQRVGHPSVFCFRDILSHERWATRLADALNAMDILITVETDLFEHRRVKPHFINPCCFGEDFAAWLRGQLSTLRDCGFIFSETIQEDYGWGFWASRMSDRFWVAVSYVGDGPQEEPAQWVISVNYDPGLNLVKRLFHKPDRRALEELREHALKALRSNAAIREVPPPDYSSKRGSGNPKP